MNHLLRFSLGQSSARRLAGQWRIPWSTHATALPYFEQQLRQLFLPKCMFKCKCETKIPQYPPTPGMVGRNGSTVSIWPVLYTMKQCSRLQSGVRKYLKTRLGLTNRNRSPGESPRLRKGHVVCGWESDDFLVTPWMPTMASLQMLNLLCLIWQTDSRKLSDVTFHQLLQPLVSALVPAVKPRC